MRVRAVRSTVAAMVAILSLFTVGLATVAAHHAERGDCEELVFVSDAGWSVKVEGPGLDTVIQLTAHETTIDVEAGQYEWQFYTPKGKREAHGYTTVQPCETPSEPPSSPPSSPPSAPPSEPPPSASPSVPPTDPPKTSPPTEPPSETLPPTDAIGALTPADPDDLTPIVALVVLLAVAFGLVVVDHRLRDRRS